MHCYYAYKCLLFSFDLLIGASACVFLSFLITPRSIDSNYTANSVQNTHNIMSSGNQWALAIDEHWKSMSTGNYKRLNCWNEPVFVKDDGWICGFTFYDLLCRLFQAIRNNFANTLHVPLTWTLISTLWLGLCCFCLLQMRICFVNHFKTIRNTGIFLSFSLALFALFALFDWLYSSKSSSRELLD